MATAKRTLAALIESLKHDLDLLLVESQIVDDNKEKKRTIDLAMPQLEAKCRQLEQKLEHYRSEIVKSQDYLNRSRTVNDIATQKLAEERKALELLRQDLDNREKSFTDDLKERENAFLSREKKREAELDAAANEWSLRSEALANERTILKDQEIEINRKLLTLDEGMQRLKELEGGHRKREAELLQKEHRLAEIEKKTESRWVEAKNREIELEEMKAAEAARLAKLGSFEKRLKIQADAMDQQLAALKKTEESLRLRELRLQDREKTLRSNLSL